MSNDDLKSIKARLFDLNSKVLELVREGKRDPRWVADIFQGIVNDDLRILRQRAELKIVAFPSLTVSWWVSTTGWMVISRKSIFP